MDDLVLELKSSLGLDKMIIKHMPAPGDRDIDVIISESEFNKLDLDNKLYLLKDRRKCDRHIFYLFYYNKEY